MNNLSLLFSTVTTEPGSVISARVNKYFKSFFAPYSSLLAEQHCNIKPNRVLCKGSNGAFLGGVELAPFTSANYVYKSRAYGSFFIFVPSCRP